MLLDSGKVLVEKRRADDEANAGLVMLPGGHVEQRETLVEALGREMLEELGIRVGATEPVLARYYTASNGEKQRVHYFLIRDWSGKIRSNEAEDVYWESNFRSLSDETERKIVHKLLVRTSP